MEISLVFKNQLKYYLQQRAEGGDFEAETLLLKLKQQEENSSLVEEASLVTPPPDFERLGC